MKRKVKISDVARESSVSTSTVSLVLNNKPGVSQETRDRVHQVANELGYPIKPKPGKNNSLTTVGMVVRTEPDIPPQANPFYSKIIIGIEDYCRKNGINLLFATLPVDENNHPVEVPQLLYNDMVDGLLMVGAFVDETITSISGKQLAPIILVDGYSNTESFDTVISDNFRASYQAVEYLIRKGHRHIGLVGSDRNCYPSFKERRNGYRRALKENDIQQEYFANFNIMKSNGFKETGNLISQNPQITALFCINDDVGGAAIRAVQSLDKHVPDDISIIGYDDTYLAVNSHPPLTTMHVDTVTMGRAAMHLLSLRLDDPESTRMSLIVHPYLVERESVARNQYLYSSEEITHA
ncbi:MAG: LacI family DNA-binding transcriptional regulator [Anaerolineales bacterium]|nr:LacI family DNA-binding transcriptional regulator [Anaerolineales bacterium]